MHEFVAKSDYDLRLAKGNRVRLDNQFDGSENGWLQGVHLRSGRFGMFPRGKVQSNVHVDNGEDIAKRL